MKREPFSVLLAITIGIALVTGCSSSKSGASGSGCDSSRCSPGNQCIDDGSGSGPACHLVCTQQSQCPAGYYCNDGAPGQPSNWCVPATLAAADGSPFTQGGGQFGTPCLPTGGEGNNGACDVADGFVCYGQSPTDAEAYCTVYGCQADSDCPGSWWCETVDVAPNVDTVKRSFGQTHTVCRPRQYCATCALDHDCPLLKTSPSATGGTQQHCVADQQGGTFCSPQCSSNADCPLDAQCVTSFPVCLPAQGTPCESDEDCPAANSTYQHCYAGSCTPECASAADCTGSSQRCGSLGACQPRAGVCVGNGGFCDPCRSDADCAQGGGVCLDAIYSTERYCSVPTRGACPSATQQGVTINLPGQGMCPAPPAGAPASSKTRGGVGCTFSSTTFAPPNQCIAFTSISDGNGGENPVPGCWTANR
jgi:hypothetical protein